jgi:hypothetical protein
MKFRKFGEKVRPGAILISGQGVKRERVDPRGEFDPGDDARPRATLIVTLRARSVAPMKQKAAA